MNATSYDIIPGGESIENQDELHCDVPPVVQLHDEFGYEPWAQGEYDYLNELFQLEEQLVC